LRGMVIPRRCASLAMQPRGAVRDPVGGPMRHGMPKRRRRRDARLAGAGARHVRTTRPGQPARALRYAKGFARGLLHHRMGHYHPGSKAEMAGRL
jgi:hypothetical protein